MTKELALDDTIDLGRATVETLGSTPQGHEALNPNAKSSMGICDED